MSAQGMEAPQALTVGRDIENAKAIIKPIVDDRRSSKRQKPIISETFEDGHVAEAVVAVDLEDDEVKPMLLVGDGYGHQFASNFRGFTAAPPKTHPYQPYVFVFLGKLFHDLRSFIIAVIHNNYFVIQTLTNLNPALQCVSYSIRLVLRWYYHR